MGREEDASAWIQHKGANGGGMMNELAAILQGQTTVSYDIRTMWVNSTHGLLWWIIVGLLAGWLAGKLARGRGFGCIGDVVLGLIGSVLGGWIFEHLGIVHANTFLYSLAAATVGAVILVSIAHLFFGGKGE
jgi:uncharacterized membrane protein YeaQ/YmgE (transglycosylase-associated protein family)